MKIIMSLIIVLVSSISAFAESTIMWYWKPNANEIMSYTVTIDDTIGTAEMTSFNNALTILAGNNSFSNLTQFQAIVNRIATGSIRDFTIVDVIVDEK